MNLYIYIYRHCEAWEKGISQRSIYVADKGRGKRKPAWHAMGIVIVCTARRRTSSPSSDRGRSGCSGTPGFQGTRQGSLAGISRVDQEQDAGTALLPRRKKVSVAARTGVWPIKDGNGSVFIIVVRFMSGSAISRSWSRQSDARSFTNDECSIAVWFSCLLEYISEIIWRLMYDEIIVTWHSELNVWNMSLYIVNC